MPKPSLFAVGQRVRIEGEDEPIKHIGKLATIERIETAERGEPVCVLKVDRVATPVALPQNYLKLIKPTPSSILANDLFLPWDVDDPSARLFAYMSDKAIAGRISEALLFHNRIVIPTVDYAIVVPLVHWLGPDLFKDMLTSEALSFVRYRGGLCYTAYGEGLATFEIHPGDEKQAVWWSRVSYDSPREAVAAQLTHRLTGLKTSAIDVFGKLVELCTFDTALPQFISKVQEETYRDIANCESLSKLFPEGVDFNRLPGLEANQSRIFSWLPKPAVVGDPIDIVLRLAMLNLEAYAAEEAGVRDMVTARDFKLVLDAKATRFTRGSTSRDAFSTFSEVNDLPDIAAAVKQGQINASDVWRFRNSKSAEQFRKWFDEVGPANPIELVREYVRSLKEGGPLNSGPGKLVRFIVLNVAGPALSTVLGPVAMPAQVALSLADNYLLEKIRLGYNPRYFVDDVRHQLFPK